ncbi:MAG: hypothetical protein NTW19_14745 [Planctomycetota bacterium]|nr:hypothetical protein [Planctomycetota bacterium]
MWHPDFVFKVFSWADRMLRCGGELSHPRHGGDVGHVGVVGVEDGEEAGAHLQQRALAGEQEVVILLVVGLGDLQVGQRSDADALGAGDHVLDVDVLAVGLPLRLGEALGVVEIDQGEDVVAVDGLAPGGERGEVGRAQVLEGGGEARVDRRVEVAVGEGVEDHGLRFRGSPSGRGVMARGKA